MPTKTKTQPAKLAGATIAAVQVCLMGTDEAAVRQAAAQLSKAGFASTGEAPMRGGAGLRIYGSMHVDTPR